MDKQCTLNGKVCFEGVGLHTGEETKIEFVPAAPNTGIFFVRKDLDPEAIIKADLYSMLDPDKFPRRTAIGNNAVSVQTIEHVMASFHLLGIDNVQVNIWGEEVPGMDGSAKEFVEELKKIGKTVQDAPRTYLTIKEPFWFEENGASLVVLPSSKTRVSYTLQYDNELIGTEYFDITVDEENLNDIFKARTFCLENEAKALIDNGLGKGSNYDNTLVVGEKTVVKNKLRFEDEFVQHKVLDLLGDLYLAGPVKAHIIAVRSGHSINIKLLNALRRYKEKLYSAAVESPSKDYVPLTSQMSIQEISSILPHRYPFLLVDRIVSLEEGVKVVGIKNVTINEHFFQGHFPSKPVMPGVLIVEAMAQVAGVLMLGSGSNRGKLAYFMAADKIKFRKTVQPGDQLCLEVTAGKLRKRTGTAVGRALVDGKVACEAELMFAIVD